MKNKNRASSRRKINFAVDREEIEVNSDWVDAVMAGPVPPRAERPPESPAAEVPPSSNDSSESNSDRPFFVPPPNTATGAESVSGAECSSVEMNAAVAESAPAADNASGEDNATVEIPATVARSLEGKELQPDGPIEHRATVEPTSTGASVRWRPRPIRRITDGLTPGQYAVYRLMYEEGQGSGSPRIYTGGYADLRRLTGLSKRGIQNIIAELQTKEVITIQNKPGYHRTETTSYLVPDAETVVQSWFAKGWRNALGKSKALLT